MDINSSLQGGNSDTNVILQGESCELVFDSTMNDALKANKLQFSPLANTELNNSQLRELFCNKSILTSIVHGNEKYSLLLSPKKRQNLASQITNSPQIQLILTQHGELFFTQNKRKKIRRELLNSGVELLSLMIKNENDSTTDGSKTENAFKEFYENSLKASIYYFQGDLFGELFNTIQETEKTHMNKFSALQQINSEIATIDSLRIYYEAILQEAEENESMGEEFVAVKEELLSLIQENNATHEKIEKIKKRIATIYKKIDKFRREIKRYQSVHKALKEKLEVKKNNKKFYEKIHKEFGNSYLSQEFIAKTISTRQETQNELKEELEELQSTNESEIDRIANSKKELVSKSKILTALDALLTGKKETLQLLKIGLSGKINKIDAEQKTQVFEFKKHFLIMDTISHIEQEISDFRKKIEALSKEQKKLETQRDNEIDPTAKQSPQLIKQINKKLETIDLKKFHLKVEKNAKNAGLERLLEKSSEAESVLYYQRKNELTRKFNKATNDLNTYKKEVRKLGRNGKSSRKDNSLSTALNKEEELLISTKDNIKKKLDNAENTYFKKKQQLLSKINNYTLSKESAIQDIKALESEVALLESRIEQAFITSNLTFGSELKKRIRSELMRKNSEKIKLLGFKSNTKTTIENIVNQQYIKVGQLRTIIDVTKKMEIDLATVMGKHQEEAEATENLYNNRSNELVVLEKTIGEILAGQKNKKEIRRKIRLVRRFKKILGRITTYELQKEIAEKKDVDDTRFNVTEEEAEELTTNGITVKKENNSDESKKAERKISMKELEGKLASASNELFGLIGNPAKSRKFKALLENKEAILEKLEEERNLLEATKSNLKKYQSLINRQTDLPTLSQQMEAQYQAKRAESDKFGIWS